MVEPLAAPPVFYGRLPAIAGITEAVGKDDGGRVLGSGRDDQACSPRGRHGAGNSERLAGTLWHGQVVAQC